MAGDYLWPTNASKHLTSSFCEFRPRHFHAAIDIKTWNRTGYKIFAIDDGYIYRIRVSANGYGKALYVKLKDGNIAVYAHLERFIPEIEAFADRLRMKRQQYVLDYFPEPSAFPVQKGQVIGYTGETGIGVPHLHFEIRDPQNRPMNPLRFYPGEVEDTIPPRARFLAVIPLKVRTFINFEPDTLIIPLHAGKTIELSEPLYLSGPAYLAIRAYDMGNGVHNKFGLYEAELLVNQVPAFHVRYDRFSYSHTHLVELDKNFSLWRKGWGKFQNLFRHPANVLPVYPDTPPEGGILDERLLNDGENTVEIRLRDFHQNETVIRGTIIFHRNLQVQVETRGVVQKKLLLSVRSPQPLTWIEIREPAASGKVSDPAQYVLDDVQKIASDFWYFLSIPLKTNPEIPELKVIPYYTAQSPGLPVYLNPQLEDPVDPEDQTTRSSVTPRIVFRGNQLGIKVPIHLVPRLLESDIFRAIPIYPLREEALMVLSVEDFFRISQLPVDEFPFLVAELQQWHPVVPGKVQRVASSNGQLEIRFESESVYDTLFCRIQQIVPDETVAVASPYRMLAPVYDVQPFDQPFRRGAEMGFRVPDSLRGVKGLGAYYWDRKKGWLFLPTRWEGNTLRARITSLEKFTLIQDTIPPVFRVLSAVRNDSLLNARRPLFFEVYDEMAGIYKEKQITVRADGRWVLFEYDPEEKFIRVDPRHLPSGARHLEVFVVDNVGNRSVHRFVLQR
ncbi:MAG: M23 family metallopeptidase [Calditrichaeota bacterium]|nr:M23 family metallopeptidase [Calditrichota bacterium]